MEYMSAAEAAEKWGIGVRRVQIFCAENKIAGAKYMGKQWIIPANAERPRDRRTKAGRLGNKNERYLFPFFAYTPLYAHKEELNEAELRLLNAQELYLQGDNAASMAECRELIISNSEPYIVFASYCMLGYNAVFMGITTEYSSAVFSAERMIENATVHKEDFRLMLESLKYHTTWNCDAFYAINAERLSVDAMRFYQTMIIMVSCITAIKETPAALKCYRSLTIETEALGMLPLAVNLHFLLASFTYHNQDLDGCMYHIKAACDIAAKHNWLALMAKYYYSIVLIDKYLYANQPKLNEHVRQFADKSLQGWQIITKSQSENGKAIFEGVDAKNEEILHLLAYGLKNKEIACILGVESIEITQRIKKMWSELGLSTREELCRYAKNEITGKQYATH